MSTTPPPLTVRFANGSTRTLPANEAIWLPDAVYDRIKFEFNLPSTARKYLEDYNDEYPHKSSPGCPYLKSLKQHSGGGSSSSSESCVVMPRMIYDIWPYYVPFYPLYSNILYSAPSSLSGNNIKALPNEHNASTFSLSTSNGVGQTAVYGRQIKAKPAVVSADCVNRSVIGSYLTAEQLDAKIRLQIQNHRHLLDKGHLPPPSSLPYHSRSRSRSRKSSPHSCCSSRSCSPFSPSSSSHQHVVRSRSASSCCSCGRGVNSAAANYSHHQESIAPPPPQHHNHNHHHQHHQHQHQHHTHPHPHPHSHHNSPHHLHQHYHSQNNLLRSKSVTFLDEARFGHEFDYAYDYESDSSSDNDVSRDMSTNTDVTFNAATTNTTSSKRFKTPRHHKANNIYSSE